MTAYIIPGLKRDDEVIAEVFNVDVTDLRRKTRKREIVDARRFAMWYRRNYNQKLDKKGRMNPPTFESIGKLYGDFNHASVMHSCKSCEYLMKNFIPFREMAIEAGRRLFIPIDIKKDSKKPLI